MMVGGGLEEEGRLIWWLLFTREGGANVWRITDMTYLEQQVAVPHAIVNERTPGLHAHNSRVVAVLCALREDEPDVACRVF